MTSPNDTPFDDAGFLELVRRIQLGDNAAWDTVWRAVERYLLKIANDELQGPLRQKTAPSDLVQNCFLRIQRGIGRFSGATRRTFFAWVRAVLWSEIKDTCRREGPLVHQEELNLGVAKELPALVPTPSSEFWKQEERDFIEECLTELSPDHQQVVRLRFHDNLDFEAIARTLDRSPQAVQKLCVRALAAFARVRRKKLGP